MTPLRLFLVDDEPSALKHLQNLLSTLEEDCPNEIVGIATNGSTAWSKLNDVKVDVVITDIHMPYMSGIELTHYLQTLPKPPAVILTTAFKEYTAAPFGIRAIDYLQKPVQTERLKDALRSALGSDDTLENSTLLYSTRSYFSVTERGKQHLVPIAQTCYLKAEQKYITLRTREREYLLEDSLIHLEKEFGNRFLRIHRNCLVAIRALARFEKVSAKNRERYWVAVLKDIPERLAVSRRQQHIVKHFPPKRH